MQKQIAQLLLCLLRYYQLSVEARVKFMSDMEPLIKEAAAYTETNIVPWGYRDLLVEALGFIGHGLSCKVSSDIACDCGFVDFQGRLGQVLDILDDLDIRFKQDVVKDCAIYCHPGDIVLVFKRKAKESDSVPKS